MTGRPNNEPQAPGNWANDPARRCKGKDMGLPHADGRRQDEYADRHGLRTICAGCPVKAPCLAWAMTEPDPAYDHVAGGLTPNERKKARR